MVVAPHLGVAQGGGRGDLDGRRGSEPFYALGAGARGEGRVPAAERMSLASACSLRGQRWPTPRKRSSSRRARRRRYVVDYQTEPRPEKYEPGTAEVWTYTHAHVGRVLGLGKTRPLRYFRRVDVSRTGRGDAAAATWRFRGGKARRPATWRFRGGKARRPATWRFSGSCRRATWRRSLRRVPSTRAPRRNSRSRAVGGRTARRPRAGVLRSRRTRPRGRRTPGKSWRRGPTSFSSQCTRTAGTDASPPRRSVFRRS